MECKHFGMMVWSGNHHYIMETERERITNKVAELFCKEILLRNNSYQVWEQASDEVKNLTIKHTKTKIEPVMFKIVNGKVRYLSYTILRKPLDENSGRGGGTLPEKYWDKELTIFWEEDLEEYV